MNHCKRFLVLVGALCPAGDTLAEYIPSDAKPSVIVDPSSEPVAPGSLGRTAALLDRPIAKIEQLGAVDPVAWSLGAEALTVTPASARPASDVAVVFKIALG